MKAWMAGMAAICGMAAAEPGVTGVRVGHPKFGNSPQSWDAPIHRTRAPVQNRPPVYRPPVHRPPSCEPVWHGGDGWRGHIGTGSGLDFDGHWSGDDWRVGVHLGSGLNWYDRCGDGWSGGWGVNCAPTWCFPRTTWGYIGGSVYTDSLFWGYPSVQVGYPAYGYDPRWAGQTYQTSQPTAPPPAAAPEPEPKTALEKGRWRLKREQPDLAVKQYQEHLGEFAHDSEAMRELAVALIDAGRLAEGVAVMREAYTANPTLADTAFDAAILGPDADDRLANLVRRTAAFANRNEGSSAWLTVTVLMQGQGRDRVALANIVKSVEAGLEDAIAQPLGDALRRRAYASK